MKRFIGFIAMFTLFFIGCSTETNTSNESADSSSYKNLNISILIDLSDRISAVKNPGQADKDIKSIGFVVESLKKFMSSKGTINSEDKIRVIFYPSSDNKLYQEIAENLIIDFSQFDIPQRRAMFNNIEKLYKEQLERLYAVASRSSQYKGADLFNYFKHRVMDDCIIEDKEYENILVLITDGYLYHTNSKFNIGNRYSFIGPIADQIRTFRNSANWEKRFEEQDYGFVTIKNDLSRLKILALEFAPVVNYPIDFDIQHKYWSKWFDEQNVGRKNYKIVKTDVPSLNKEIIVSFMNKAGA